MEIPKYQCLEVIRLKSKAGKAEEHNLLLNTSASCNKALAASGLLRGLQSLCKSPCCQSPCVLAHPEQFANPRPLLKGGSLLSV